MLNLSREVMIAISSRPNPRLPLQIYGKYARDKYSEKKSKNTKIFAYANESDDKHFFSSASLRVSFVGLNIIINSRGSRKDIRRENLFSYFIIITAQYQ